MLYQTRISYLEANMLETATTTDYAAHYARAHQARAAVFRAVLGWFAGLGRSHEKAPRRGAGLQTC